VERKVLGVCGKRKVKGSGKGRGEKRWGLSEERRIEKR